MKEFIENFYKKEHFWTRLVAVLLGVITMGFCLSLLIRVGWGTDPCTLMNKSIAKTIGMSIGNWQALLNCIMLVFVLFFGGKNIGFGTLANMFLVGYSLDFFSWVWRQVLPDDFFDPIGVKFAVFIPALIVFVIAVAIYIDMELGTSPYDSVPNIISERFPKIPFRFIRMAFDFTVIGIGMAFGGGFEIVTILMAFMLGPVIGMVGSWIKKKWNFDQK